MMIINLKGVLLQRHTDVTKVILGLILIQARFSFSHTQTHSHKRRGGCLFLRRAVQPGPG